MKFKSVKKAVALALAAMMAIGGGCLTASAADTTHVLEASKVTAGGEGTWTDGQQVKVDDYFTLCMSAKTKVDSSSKTWDDGYTSEQRINFGSGVTVADGVAKDAIAFTTKGAATVKVWWVEADESTREMTILKADGTTAATSTEGAKTEKNKVAFSTLTVSEAGTYYLGGTPKKNYIFKVEVTETAAATTPAPTTTPAAAKTYKYTFNDGTAKEAVPTGADWVVVTDVYSKDKGYGFNVVPAGGAGVYAKQVAAETNTKVTAGSDIGLDIDVTSELYAGICRAMFADKNGTDFIFKVDLPAGTYKFNIYAGGISSNNTYDTNKIFLDGVAFDQAAVNGGPKDAKGLYKVEDITYTKTITLTEAKTVEVKASNPSVANAETGKTDGGRAYLNAVVIETVASDSAVVPKTGVVSAAAVCGVVALAGAGVAVVSRKKED